MIRSEQPAANGVPGKEAIRHLQIPPEFSGVVNFWKKKINLIEKHGRRRRYTQFPATPTEIEEALDLPHLREILDRTKSTNFSSGWDQTLTMKEKEFKVVYDAGSEAADIGIIKYFQNGANEEVLMSLHYEGELFSLKYKKTGYAKSNSNGMYYTYIIGGSTLQKGREKVAFNQPFY